MPRSLANLTERKRAPPLLTTVGEIRSGIALARVDELLGNQEGGSMTAAVTDVKAALTEKGLTELRFIHGPALFHEETARLAERETLSYERYLYSW